MHELVYTSAPKGLKPGSQGFCTVACSAGMPPNLMMRLESLSGYRPLVPPGQHAAGGIPAGASPVVRSHLVVRVGGTDWHVLSRIADAGIDYTQRANKIAHHIAFEPSELPPVGPAALLACESRFFCSWDGEPKLIMKPAPFPQLESQPQICKSWGSVTGDAGWGGVLAETARENRQIMLVVTPEMDTITLFGESLALLPPEIRWQTTLTTYYTRFPGGIGCRWCCVMAGSPEISQMGLSPDAMLIDLTQPLKIPVPGPLVKLARSGVVQKRLPIAEIRDLSAEVRDQSAEASNQGKESHQKPPEFSTQNPELPKTPKKPKKPKRSKQDRLSKNHEPLPGKDKPDGKQQEKWGVLVLLGLGLLFFGVPAWLIVMMVFAKGCHGRKNE